MDVVYLGLLAAGFGAMWWQHARHVRSAPRLGTRFGEDADIALHVARHAASSRGIEVSSTCILYGLLQDETIAAAIRRTGGDPDRVEDAVLEALEAREADSAAAGIGDDDEGDITAIIGMLLSIAGANARRVGCVDLWAGLAQHAPTPTALVEAGGCTAADVLFTLVHDIPEAEVPWPAGTMVNVVLVNDDISTQELVVTVLRETFGFDARAAHELMLQVHNQGRGEIGELVVSEARTKIAVARRRARGLGYPLWIRAETAT